MKSVYERTNLIITEFDAEDVIVTSGESPIDPTPTEPPLPTLSKRENRYGSFSSFDKTPGSWF